MLVVVAVLAVLAGLALPALLSARRAGAQARALSDARQNAVQVLSHASSHDQKPPIAEPMRLADGTPNGMAEFWFADGSGARIEYFAQFLRWTAGLVAAGDDWSATWGPATRPPADAEFLVDRAFTGPAADALSMAFLASPEFWSGDESDQTLDRWRLLRCSDVRSPAGKSLLVREFGGCLDERTGRAIVSTADGASRVARLADAGASVPIRFYFGRNMAFVTTRDGVRGRDL